MLFTAHKAFNLLDNITLATFLLAEFGFLGVVEYNLEIIPLF
jgi:hypothetical protein